MRVMLDTMSDRTEWLAVDDSHFEQIEACDDPGFALYHHAADMDDAGKPLPAVGVDVTELNIHEAMRIADTYGGGEFDGEAGAIVIALCALRDHIKSQGITS